MLICSTSVITHYIIIIVCGGANEHYFLPLFYLVELFLYLQLQFSVGESTVHFCFLLRFSLCRLCLSIRLYVRFSFSRSLLFYLKNCQNHKFLIHRRYRLLLHGNYFVTLSSIQNFNSLRSFSYHIIAIIVFYKFSFARFETIKNQITPIFDSRLFDIII